MPKPKIIVAGIPGDRPSAPEFIETTGLFNPEECDFVSVNTPADMVAMVASQPVTAVLLAGQITTNPETVAALLMGPTILEHFPDGVALLDSCGGVLWANDILESFFNGRGGPSANFLTALGTPKWAHPSGDCSVPSTWLDKEASADSGGLVLRMPDDRFLHLQSSPLFSVPPAGLQDAGEKQHNTPEGSIVVVRDVTRTMLEQQKRAAIHQAGQTLADLTPTELADMTVQERIELLKSNIIYYSKDLLKFDVLEIRLLDRQTSRLEPLLAEGMQPEAELSLIHI